MTRANAWIGDVARRAEAWPLAPIAAVMLAAAAGFFCYAMPSRLLAALPGPFGVSASASAEGRIAFVCLGALLAGGLGWLAVAAAGSRRKPVESEVELEAAATRRRPIGPSNPAEALNAPPPTLLAVRRGDGHPDAPPRRPIFAHELGRSLDSDDGDAAPAEPETPEAPIAEQAPPEEAKAATDPEEPLELIDTIETPVPSSPAHEPPSLAALMARFEEGLDRRDGEPAAAPIRTDARDGDDALRDALAALQRMAARQR